MWNIFDVNNKKTPDWRLWRRSDDFVVKSEHVSPFSGDYMFDLEQVNVSWACVTSWKVARGFFWENILENSQNSTFAEVYLNKVAGLRTAILFKKRLQHRLFPLHCSELLFLQNICRWLLLWSYFHYGCYFQSSNFTKVNLIQQRIFNLWDTVTQT